MFEQTSSTRALAGPPAANQWVLLYQGTPGSPRSFYPFRKREIQPRITDANPRSSVSEILRLSQVGSTSLTRRSKDLQLAPPMGGQEYVNRFCTGWGGEALGRPYPMMPEPLQGRHSLPCES